MPYRSRHYVPAHAFTALLIAGSMISSLARLLTVSPRATLVESPIDTTRAAWAASALGALVVGVYVLSKFLPRPRYYQGYTGLLAIAKTLDLAGAWQSFGLGSLQVVAAERASTQASSTNSTMVSTATTQAYTTERFNPLALYASVTAAAVVLAVLAKLFLSVGPSQRSAALPAAFSQENNTTHSDRERVAQIEGPGVAPVHSRKTPEQKIAARTSASAFLAGLDEPTIATRASDKRHLFGFILSAIMNAIVTAAMMRAAADTMASVKGQPSSFNHMALGAFFAALSAVDSAYWAHQHRPRHLLPAPSAASTGRRGCISAGCMLTFNRKLLEFIMQAIPALIASITIADAIVPGVASGSAGSASALLALGIIVAGVMAAVGMWADRTVAKEILEAERLTRMTRPAQNAHTVIELTGAGAAAGSSAASAPGDGSFVMYSPAGQLLGVVSGSGRALTTRTLPGGGVGYVV